jgi:hypothetical protein
MLNRTISLLGIVGILSAGIIVSGFINIASARVVCKVNDNGLFPKIECIDLQPLEPIKNTLPHLSLSPGIPPHPPHPTPTNPPHPTG